jgi:hypothetical protein
MIHSLLLATYPGGNDAFAYMIGALSIFALTGLCSLLGIALAPFLSTARVAHKLGFIGIWGGLVALALALVSSGFVASERVQREMGTARYRAAVRASLVMAGVIALAPLTGVGALCWSRRTAKVNSISLED